MGWDAKQCTLGAKKILFTEKVSAQAQTPLHEMPSDAITGKNEGFRHIVMN